MDLRGILVRPHVWLFAFVAFSAAVPLFAATDSAGPNAPAAGNIQIEYPAQVFLPYRERRPRHQFTAHVQYENFAPTGYLSPSIADPTTVSNTYQNVYDLADIPVVSLSVGWKFNIPFLGIEIAPFYGAGGVQSSRTGESMTLNVEKYGARFAAYLETLFSEPYIVPYVATQFQLWGIEETGSTLSFSRSTGYAVGVQAGLLLQLNWLDENAALQAMNESGLNNTYLDVFVQQYGDTSDPEDPIMSSDFNWGVGLRLEY